MSIASLLALTLTLAPPLTPAERITPRTLPAAGAHRLATGRLPQRAVHASGAAAAHRLPPRPRRPREQRRGGARLRAGVRAPVDRRAVALPGDDAGLRRRRQPLHDAAAAARADPPDLARSARPAPGASSCRSAPGERGGGAVPLVLRDPETGGEVVYVNSYERLLAVRTDGTPVWDDARPASATRRRPISRRSGWRGCRTPTRSSA